MGINPNNEYVLDKKLNKVFIVFMLVFILFILMAGSEELF